MLIYSVQVTIAKKHEQAWLDYMQGTHLNDVIQTGCFSGHQMMKQTDWDSETESRYVINYACPSRQILDEYFELHAPKLREDVSKHFGGLFAAERRVFEVLE